jgi:hypothetical protein
MARSSWKLGGDGGLKRYPANPQGPAGFSPNFTSRLSGLNAVIMISATVIIATVTASDKPTLFPQRSASPAWMLPFFDAKRLPNW